MRKYIDGGSIVGAMIDIKNRFTGAVLYRSESATDIRAAVVEAVAARANLNGATLVGANLYRANLDGATLVGASLYRANLVGATLYRANLALASLDGANLVGANLVGANLVGANLARASLDGANLDGASLASGETWEAYLAEVVPALCIAGGRPLSEVATPKHWSCNSWDNCPMAAAFRVNAEDGTPLLLRPRIRQFVQLFDAGLIPMPLVEQPGSSE